MSTLRISRWLAAPVLAVVAVVAAVVAGPANADTPRPEPITWYQLSGACIGREIHGLHWNMLNGDRLADFKRIYISAEGYCYLRQGIGAMDDFARIPDAGYLAAKRALTALYDPYTPTSQGATYRQRVAVTVSFAQSHSTDPAAVRVALDQITGNLDDVSAAATIREIAGRI